MKNDLKKQFFVLSVIFTLLAIARLILALTEGPISTLLWFCVTILFLFPIGLYFKNKLIISSVITSGFILNLALSIEVISYSLTGKILLGIGTYLNDLSPLGHLITFYHLFLVIGPIYIIFLMKDFHKYSWIFSSFHFLIISLATFFLTNFSENCVRAPCELGFFNLIYAIKPVLIPFFIFHWILITLIILIPTNIIFYYIIKRLQ